jgi:hypothetical protein
MLLLLEGGNCVAGVILCSFSLPAISDCCSCLLSLLLISLMPE